MEEIFKILEAWFAKAKQGESSELEAYLNFDIVAKKATEFKESIISDAINEFEYSIGDKEKSLKIKGYRLSKKESVKYDYTTYPRFLALKKEITEIQELMKAAYVQSLNGNELVTEDGEIIPPAIKNYGKESITITKIK